METIDTRFYATDPRTEQVQEEFFNLVLQRTYNPPYRHFSTCFNRREPRTDRDLNTKLYHIGDCTVVVNKNHENKAAAITGRILKIDETKSQLEEMTGITLIRINVLAGKD